MTIVGIDLGTTNSLIGAIYEGEVRLFADPDGNELIPSVIGTDEQGKLLVGRAARNRRIIDPEGTVMSIKRRMGQSKTLDVGGQKLSPTQVSALILGHLLDLAEPELGARPERAVITVPAYFDDAQRQATKDAGELCGLKVERLVNEPTAAAMTYQTGTEENVLVYDLGGGTFDVSILERDEGFMEVRASRGDTQLGGDDIDAALVEFILGKLSDKVSAIVRSDIRAMARLSEAAERAKMSLSVQPNVMLSEAYLSGTGAEAIHLDLELTREDFDEIAAPFIERTLGAIDEAMSDANMQPDDLDRVLLVGGSSQSPIVAKMVTKHLGRPAQVDLDADRAVVLGAARLAGRLGGEPIDEILVDITPHTLSVGSLDDDTSPYCEEEDLRAAPVAKRDMVVPLEVSRTFYTVGPGQSKVIVPICQGEHERFGDNTFLGKLLVEGIPPSPGHSAILVTFRLDISGVLEVEAEHVDSGESQSTRIVDSPARLTAQQRKKAKDAVNALRANSDGPQSVSLDPALAQRAATMQARAERALAACIDTEGEPVRAALASLAAAVGNESAEVEARIDDLADTLLDLL